MSFGRSSVVPYTPNPHALALHDLIRDLHVARDHGMRIVTAPAATRYLDLIAALDAAALAALHPTGSTP